MTERDSSQSTLTRKFVLRFLLALLIYSGALVAVIVVCIVAARTVTWQAYGLLYSFLKLIDRNLFLVGLAVWIIGLVVLAIFYMRKALGFLDLVVDATRTVVDDRERLLKLPTDLSDFEHQLNEIKLDLAQSEQAARQAEQKKNDLVVYLAHDLKTPLTSVIGYLTLLRDENQISEELREKYLSISLSKAERLEDLINEFFEITRFNLTELTLDYSEIDLVRMLEQIRYDFTPMLEQKGLICRMEAPETLSLRCDADKIQRVFDNLLRNAVNYSDPDTPIHIVVGMRDGSVNLAFENRGSTIPPEKLQRIFEQFYRLDTARTTGSGGAGLGLAIAKQIVEQHGGEIRAESTAGVTRFTVSLPLHETLRF